ncbi:glycosyltransferase family 4 protein [Algoriphagus sp.]|uniref:glycosyltransferase family 4 protein n=1 Tax=Algoriphagus sp. TaxID=1872435 RepID=UPI002727261B|nr:glycosyltransferase family 4 protein [Algoriphagus sp.]MDO8967479.1 glycosyltransferase family 4 protein [Algoriphagus sp.]MDP3201789.1 glycosyltransferase family 4 protein [Algoriphagus sp.]
MSIVIVTQVFHKLYKNEIYAYGPYAREMNIWFKKFDNVFILSPFIEVQELNPIDIQLEAQSFNLIKVPDFDLTSVSNLIQSFFLVPYIFFKILVLFSKVDHIHLRCPGNMGLLGSFAQIFYPNKKKTAKYAGNWDLNSKQPLSYRIQQKLLRSTVLTKNIKVLVYGDWPDQTKNILPFFTASYSRNQISPFKSKKEEIKSGLIKFLFVGSLVSGKNPDFSLDFCAKLKSENFQFRFDFFGEGPLFPILLEKRNFLGLQENVIFHGNVSSEILIDFFKSSHFLIFLSDSEGWPKAVAEAMFWGCIPVTSSVSCVPQMVNYGERGILVSKDLDLVIQEVTRLIEDPDKFDEMALLAKQWSNEFTLEKFEEEIFCLV